MAMLLMHVNASRNARNRHRNHLNRIHEEIDVSGVHHFNTAMQIYKTGDVLQALSAIDQALKVNPQNTKYLINRSQFKFDLKQFQASFEDAEAVSKLDKADWMAYYRMALAQFYLSNYGLAERACFKGLRVYPDATEISVLLSGIYYTVKRYEECIRRSRLTVAESDNIQLCREGLALLCEAYRMFFPPETMSTKSYEVQLQKKKPGSLVASEGANDTADDDDSERSVSDTEDMMERFRLAKKAGSIDSLTKKHTERILEAGALALQNYHDYQLAIRHWENAMIIARLTEHTDLIAECYCRLGSVYRIIGEYEQSVSYYMSAIQITTNLTYHSKAQSGLGNTFFAMGSYKRSLEFHTKHLQAEVKARNEEGMGTAYNNIACVQFVLGRFQVALEFYTRYLHKCEALQNQLGICTALNNIANCRMHTKQFIECRDTLHRATTTEHELLFLDTVAKYPHSSVKKTALIQIVKQTYKIATEMYIRSFDYEAALVASENGKTRSFIDALTVRQVQLQATDPDILGVRDYCSATGNTILSYAFISRGRLCVWVCSGSTNEINYRIVKWSMTSKYDLLKLLEKGLREASDEGATTKYSSLETLRQLFDMLIRPINKFLPSNPKEPLVIIPQGILFSVPFLALHNTVTKKYFVEEHTVSFSDSFLTLICNWKQRPKTQFSWNPGRDKCALLYDSTISHGHSEHEYIRSRLGVTMEAPALGGSPIEIVEQMRGSAIVHITAYRTSGFDEEKEEIESAAQEDAAPQIRGTLVFMKNKESKLRETKPSRPDIISLELNTVHLWKLSGTELMVLNTTNSLKAHNSNDCYQSINLAREIIASGVSYCIVNTWPVTNGDASVILWNRFYELAGTQHDRSVDKSWSSCLQQSLSEEINSGRLSHWVNWASWMLYE